MICWYSNRCCCHCLRCCNTCPECGGYYTHKWWCSKRRDVVPLPIVLPVKPIVIERSPAKKRSNKDW